MKIALSALGMISCACLPVLAGPAVPPTSSSPSTGSSGSMASNSPIAGVANATCVLPHNGVAIGYDSDFLCRGMEMGKDLIWARAGFAVPLADKLTIGAAVWYGEALDNNLQELDGIFNLAYDAGPVTLGLNFKWYHYFDHGDSMDHDMGMHHDMGMGGMDMMMMPMADNYYDLTPSITAHLGPVDVTAAYTYEFESEGHFFEVFASGHFAVHDRVTLVPSVGVGYTSNWMMPGEGWNNIGLRLDIPIKIVDGLSVTPYIGANFPLEALEAHQDDILVGGVKLQYSW